MSTIFSDEGLLGVGLGGVESFIIESIIDETSVDLREGGVLWFPLPWFMEMDDEDDVDKDPDLRCL